MGKRWFPLESNPEVMNAYIAQLGFPAELYRFVDILSTDDWAQDMVPRPVLAVLLLYPIKESTEMHNAQEAKRIEDEGQIVAPRLVYMKQTVSNACGTVAILHALANNYELVKDSVPEESFLANFVRDTKDMNPDQIAAYIEEDTRIEQSHEAATKAGETKLGDIDEPINTHFICFVQKDGNLYELDGRKQCPINHGESSEEAVLPDSVKVMKEFIARDPGELRFTMVALAAAEE